MKDFISRGAGCSRYLKSVSDFLTRFPNYNAFAQALTAGTLPIDLNGVNPAGYTQKGTPINKATLLTDETAAIIGGLGADPTPDQAFAALGTVAALLNPISIAEITTTAAAARLEIDMTGISWSDYSFVTVEASLNTSAETFCYIRLNTASQTGGGKYATPIMSSEEESGIAVFFPAASGTAAQAVRLVFHPLKSAGAKPACECLQPGHLTSFGRHDTLTYSGITSLFIVPYNTQSTIPAGAKIKIWGNK